MVDLLIGLWVDLNIILYSLALGVPEKLSLCERKLNSLKDIFLGQLGLS